MLRPWRFAISLDRRSAQAVYLQIAFAIIEDIKRGRISSGAILPSSRKLAESLGINRKTAVLAYEELTAQGWLTSDTTRGTFVSSELPALKATARPPNTRVNAEKMPERPAYPLQETPPSIPANIVPPDVMSFDDGLADARLMPADDLARAWRRALFATAQGASAYGDPRGTLQLRRAVSTMLNTERGLATNADNICIVRGSQMGIYLAAKILLKPGDVVVTEKLSYPAARDTFRAAGACVLAIGLDAHGMRLDELEILCRKRRVRAIYVTPHHQFPTTVLLKPERRLRLMLLAEQFGFAIIEDDYDHDFHFTHGPMLPLASMDRGGKVIYIGSMSKLLSPAMRLGYLAAPSRTIESAAAHIMLIDRQGDPITETAVAELMEGGDLRRHANKARRVYGERRAYFDTLLKRRFVGDLDFTLPEGGLAVWVRFKKHIDMGRLAVSAEREKVQLLTGQMFSFSSAVVPAARLGYGRLNAEEMDDITQRLKRALVTATK
jgi:GntR family transcriptional regulator / MocR family aminotransferase